MFKHKLKLFLREAWARFLFHTGLHKLVDRLMPRRLTILAGHCVEPSAGGWEGGAHLPADMKIAEGELERIVAWMKRHYRMVTIGEGVSELESGAGGQSLVALSVDDGYRDNHDVLLPLLDRQGIGATVFLESRPLDERRVNWTHKLFWLLGRDGETDAAVGGFVAAYGRHAGQTDTFHAINQVVSEDRGRLLYHVKRILKYDADFAERDAAIDAIFAEEGGDEASLCAALYMTWDHARALRDAGVELGGHTVNHPILARLTADEQRREIAGGREALRRELGIEPETFAYPFGRRWDFDDGARESVRSAGFHTAVTMHAGTNRRGAEPTTFHRLALADGVELHLLAAEACGGFDLLRKLGIDLSE